MRGNRRRLARASAWRYEPSDVAMTVASEHARERWDEARAKAIAWAVAAAADPRVVYLDTETTGFGPRAEIVDIAVVSGAGDVLLESLVRPTRKIPADVIAVHGITDADVADAPPWCDLYERVISVLTDRRIVVYNVTFDRQMVDQSCGQYALPPPAAEWDCAMKRYAGYYGSWDPKQRWYRFQKLERAVLAFGAEPGGHRAAADALACRKVVLGMAATKPPMCATNGSLLDTSSTRYPTGPVSTAGPAVAIDTPQPESVPATVSGPRARWSTAARAFLALLEGLPEPLRERPGACGGWSPREVAAHCAGWEEEAARRLRLIAAKPDIADRSYNDIDGFNGASVAVRARLNWTETLDDLTRNVAALGVAAAAIPDDPRTHEWLSGRAADFESHSQGLQQWRVDVASLSGAAFAPPLPPVPRSGFESAAGSAKVSLRQRGRQTRW